MEANNPGIFLHQIWGGISAPSQLKIEQNLPKMMNNILLWIFFSKKKEEKFNRWQKKDCKIFFYDISPTLDRRQTKTLILLVDKKSLET